MTCEPVSDISVVIDGGAALHPEHVIIPASAKDTMYIDMPASTPFLSGQAVTWAYSNPGACDILELAPPNTEAASQTYPVDNQLRLSAFSNGFSNGFGV